MSKSITPSNVEIEVYFEGIFVPTQSIEIHEQFGAPPSIKISMPAHSGALRLLPGTIVQVFGKIERSVRVTTTDSAGNAADLIATKDSANSSVREKVLLFEGEVTGQAYSKDPSNRAVSITAQGLLAKWSKVYLHSADLMSDRLLFSALYIYQSWTDLPKTGSDKVIDTDGTPQAQETIIKPIEDGSSKYARFEYSNNLTGIDSLESWLITAMDGPNADTEAYARGDFMPFFQDLISHLEYLNLFYGVFAKTYRISDTIFTFPNVAVKDALNLLIEWRVASSTATGMAEQITLIDILFQVLSLMSYTMIMPAAPTHGVHPYQKQKTSPHNGLTFYNQVPMRGFMLPDMKFSVPALCNVLFPDEVERFDFSRNMAGEPTRLFMGISPTAVKINSTTLNEITATYIVPGLPIYKPDDTDSEVFNDTEYHFGYTPEETYRGVDPLRANFGGLENAFIQSLLKPPAEEPAGEGEIAATMSPSNKMGALAYNTATIAFHSARLSTRSCSFQTVWNPFRIVGLPGLYFDMDGSPSIMGVLSSVSTLIDAQGSVRQNVTFDMARVVYDLGGKDRIEDLLPSLVDGKDIHTKTREAVDEEVFQFNAMHADKLPWLPAWYDKNWYGHDHVGRDVYSLIIAGTRSKYTTPKKDSNGEDDPITKHDSAWTNPDAQPTPAFPEEVRERFNDNNGHFGAKIDYSIFNFIRTGARGWFKVPDGEDALLAVKADDIEEHIAAKRIAHAIRALKRAYKEAQLSGREKGFILGTTSRKLVPKVAYWAFMGVKAAQSGTMTEDHHLTKEVNLSAFWASLWAPTVKEGDHKYSVLGASVTRHKNILDKFYTGTTDWAKAMEDFELHPYVELRRDHVLTMATLVNVDHIKVTR